MVWHRGAKISKLLTTQENLFLLFYLHIHLHIYIYMCSDSIFNLLKRDIWQFLILSKTMMSPKLIHRPQISFRSVPVVE